MKHQNSIAATLGPISSEIFGMHVFNRQVMEKMLPAEVYTHVMQAKESREKLNPLHADAIAFAMREWAMSFGATHYCHWFQPLTGASAEKHDSFIDWCAPDGVIEKFNGKQLIQSEPDASSFPSGGLRSTYEARGYTGWDPSSPVFLWKAGDGVTLCIPSIFFSWTGAVLDSKIPLLRSDEALNSAVLRLLKLTGTKATRAYSTLGCEQEYFLIDRSMRNQRPDLLLAERTVFGAPSPKGQELQDHYFGSVKERVLSYMQEFENVALQLGIPVKTRHNEVAPSQFEIACVYEKAGVAVDHNILLMQVMRRLALKHDLVCILHEKPFQGINGSGKHNNWSIATDSGHNLLDPTDAPENSLQFLVLLASILEAVHTHADLLLCSIASASNDERLGGHEAPPAIFSVYLGDALEELLDNIETKGKHRSTKKNGVYDFGLPILPQMSKDNTDRNRTSPFAFTGNKFEFRAVGSSANCAKAVALINISVAQALNAIVDEIYLNIESDELPNYQELAEIVLPVVRKSLKKSRCVRFSGDNYSASWMKEAERRKLPKIKNAVHAYQALKTHKTRELFRGILTKEELDSRFEILVDTYSHTINIEANLMLDLFKAHILPACIQYQEKVAVSLNALKEAIGKKPTRQTELLKELVKAIEEAIKASKELEEEKQHADPLTGFARGSAFADQVNPKMKQLREKVDHLEGIVDDALWPLPKYRELLFLV